MPCGVFLCTNMFDFHQQIPYNGIERWKYDINSWDIKERVVGYDDLFKNQVIPEIPLPPKSEWFWSDDIMEFVEQHDFTNILTLVDSDNDYNKYLIYP